MPRWTKRGLTPIERAKRLGLGGLTRGTLALKRAEERVEEAIVAAVAEERQRVTDALDMKYIPPAEWGVYRQIRKRLGLDG